LEAQLDCAEADTRLALLGSGVQLAQGDHGLAVGLFGEGDGDVERCQCWFARYVPADRMSSVMKAKTSSSGGVQSKPPRWSSVQPSREMFDP